MKTHRKNTDEEKQTEKVLRNGFVFIIVCFVIVSTIVIWKGSINDPGPLGDALNGLLAPFITLLAAYLVFYSFKAQIKANKMQQEANRMISAQWHFDAQLKIFNDLTERIKLIEVKKSTVTFGTGAREEVTTHSGVDAIRTLGRTEWQYIQDEIRAVTALYLLLSDFSFLLHKIIAADIENKEYLSHKVQMFYLPFRTSLRLIANKYKENETDLTHNVEMFSGLVELVEKKFAELTPAKL